jgi:hypothetical protein
VNGIDRERSVGTPYPGINAGANTAKRTRAINGIRRIRRSTQIKNAREQAPGKGVGKREKKRDHWSRLYKGTSVLFLQRLDDAGEHGFGVAEEHEGVVGEE